jgi:hypothetical protein
LDGKPVDAQIALPDKASACLVIHETLTGSHKYGRINFMKTTLEIPDAIFRRAKSVAAERGISLREFVTQAVRDKLSANAKTGEKPWVKHMGKLKHLRKETERINRFIEEDTERIEAEMWR